MNNYDVKIGIYSISVKCSEEIAKSIEYFAEVEINTRKDRFSMIYLTEGNNGVIMYKSYYYSDKYNKLTEAFLALLSIDYTLIKT